MTRYGYRKGGTRLGIFVLMVLVMTGCAHARKTASRKDPSRVPSLREVAPLTFAPEVPPPIDRREPAIVEVHLNSSVAKTEIKTGVRKDT